MDALNAFLTGFIQGSAYAGAFVLLVCGFALGLLLAHRVVKSWFHGH